MTTTWFGNTTVDGTTAIGANYVQGMVFPAPATGNISAGRAPLAGGSGSNPKAKMLIYAQSAANPGALLGASDELVITAGSAMSLRTFTFSTPVAVTSGTNYYLTIFMGVNYCDVQYNSVTANTLIYVTATYPTAPNPFGTPTSTSGTFYIEAGIDVAAQPRPVRINTSQGWVDIADATSFVSGAGAPTAAVGATGAIYLDTATGRVYGPKAAGAWPSTSLGKLLLPGNTYTDVMAHYSNYAALLAG
jgi:hypothetical protein